MSYGTIAHAKALTGVDISQELLDEAQATIHSATSYRWETTSTIDTFSSKDYRAFFGQNTLVRAAPTQEISALVPRSELSIFLKMPVIAISSFTIDDVAQTEGTDYELREEIGELRICSFAFIGSSSLTGVNDISVTYTYGWGTSHALFPMIQGIEARIALLLKNNPLLLPNITLQGDAVTYQGILGEDAIGRLLKRIPKPLGLKAIPK